jgi:Ca2+-binding RTX toxin-like protein
MFTRLSKPVTGFILALGLASTPIMLSGSAGAATTPSCFGRTATIVGTAGDDNLVGTGTTDVIYGGGGSDTITGRNGDDYMCAGDGDDSILDGGRGHDHIQAGPGDDGAIWGSDGNDIMFGGTGDDYAWGFAGDDTIHGNAGDDYVEGRAGKDILYGDNGQDRLLDLEDSVEGDQTYFADRLYGGAGNDQLTAYSYKGGGTAHPADLLDGGSNITPDGPYPFEDQCGGDPEDTFLNCETVTIIVDPPV